jgi:hypothetical protein
MNKKDFLRKVSELSGDERNLFILSSGLMNNNSIKSVNDLVETLGINFTSDEVVSMNKYMYYVSLRCRITGENLFEYLFVHPSLLMLRCSECLL